MCTLALLGSASAFNVRNIIRYRYVQLCIILSYIYALELWTLSALGGDREWAFCAAYQSCNLSAPTLTDLSGQRRPRTSR